MKPTKLQFTVQWQIILTDYVTAIAWSPNDQHLAAASAAGEVILHHPATDTATTLRAATGQAMNALDFSPDGQFLAVAGQSGTVLVWHLPTPSHSPTPPLPHSPPLSPAWIDQLTWHPSQNLLAYSVNSLVNIWDPAQKTIIAELDFQDSSVLHLAWQPQGEHLAVSGHGGLKVWSTADWNDEPKSLAVPGASLYTAWSTDGRYLGSGNLDRTLTVTEWEKPPPWLMQGFPGKVRQLAWSTPVTKSGDPLLAAACVEGVTVWERETSSGSGWRSRVLQHHTDRVNAIAFQPDSLRLTSAGQDGQVGLWLDGKRLTQTLKGFQEGVACLSWNPTGERLAAGGTAGDIKIWSVSHRAQGFG
ncbi:MAG: WD40 repeat domain-containing protein [Cyanobacteria bacterium J06626_18]